MWKVEKTPCYPNSFKVKHTKYRDDNSFCHYFPTKELAQKEANKRNNRENINS